MRRRWVVETATGKYERWPTRATARKRATLLRRTDGPHHVTVRRETDNDNTPMAPWTFIADARAIRATPERSN